jgi:hypothetical protein
VATIATVTALNGVERTVEVDLRLATVGLRDRDLVAVAADVGW